ncbi:phospholipase D-like domain-containing protein [Algoriphagus aquimarinus]|uniref:PLD-like domain-containing protein n=1 Tax=Algoriphagus aquimarinus TaxID=237018 RepID=A0A1I1CBM5_9BACT|nr:phospholipase D-like domain-containing protein [Algoriphagus aquimarinus]SFB59797.1 PLD-like domain-containing protein [Algoriphagus aquimarinus]
MTQIIQQLGPELKKALMEAEEVWVAVALMNEEGLKLIQESIPDEIKSTFILGIGLPTHPEVFNKLYKQELLTDKVEAYLHKGNFYHPKLYLIKSVNGFTAFVGSANATSSGYHKNVELSIKWNCNPDDFETLIKLVEQYKKSSIKISVPFIDKYKKSYALRKKLHKQEQKLIDEDLNNAEKVVNKSLGQRSALIEDLKKFRKSPSYKTVFKERGQVIQDLRDSLDHPIFDELDLDKFFKIKELGTLMPFPKNRIKADQKRFKNYLQFLSDSSVDLAERFQRAFDGDYYLEGMGQAFISKILTINEPNSCWVQNDVSLAVLEKYGLKLPKGLKPGEKYKVAAKFLEESYSEAGLDNMAILDEFLFSKGNI